MVSDDPTGPDVGTKPVSNGLIVKLLALDPVPPTGVVTLIGPVDPDGGTVAVMLMSEFTVKVVATPVLNATAVAPLKLTPVMVACVPEVPLVGVKELMMGAGMKLLALVPTPVDVVTVIGPVVALAGTCATIDVSPHVFTIAARLLNLTVLVP